MLKRKPLMVLLLAIAAVFIIFFAYHQYTNKNSDLNINDEDITTASIIKGHIEKTVSASGTIMPINVIKVGTQVSGTVGHIYVDYNDTVKKGQLLAVLDLKLFEAKKDSAEAAVKKNESLFNLASFKLKRIQALQKRNYASQEELDTAEHDYNHAREEVKFAKAELKQATTNLEYAYIRSPVNGTIISRDVDEGQTVAASFQTPTLFQVAEDLRQMQIEADVSEADIGMIHPKETVQFTVDAYPNENFYGTVSQVRLNPKVEQNVVTYTVIVNIDNTKGMLLPGMTAFLDIKVAAQNNILKIPNSVFQFTPNQELLKLLIKKYPFITEKLPAGQSIIYLYKDKNIEPVIITKGLSNFSETEIQGAKITEGGQVIVNIEEQKKSGFTLRRLRLR